jgi:hypothetical protein
VLCTEVLPHLLLAAVQTVHQVSAPPVPLLSLVSHRVDDLANRIDHELGLLPLDEVAAVRIGDVLGAQKRGEMVVSRPPRLACRLRTSSARDKFKALIRGEHDSGDAAHRRRGAELTDAEPVVGRFQVFGSARLLPPRTKETHCAGVSVSCRNSEPGSTRTRPDTSSG